MLASCGSYRITGTLHLLPFKEVKRGQKGREGARDAEMREGESDGGRESLSSPDAASRTFHSGWVIPKGAHWTEKNSGGDWLVPKPLACLAGHKSLQGGVMTSPAKLYLFSGQ